ncbi:hypothetical protein Y032_0024g936 [Ancylostoma ceylanicum]|nr:hypothetical protein Y032_0024g936 [Ancylostoma ceylanicum]
MRVCIGLLILIIGLFGSIVNIHNVIVMYYLKDFSTSYGYLCIARGICNIVNLFLFVFYTAPDTIFKFLPPGDEVGRTGQLITGIFYAAIPIIQFGAAFNRVIAICVPFHYNTLCSKKWASAVIAVGLSYGTCVSLHEVIAKCRFVYNPSIISWEYLDCSRQSLEIKLIYPVLFITATTLTMNLFIATKIVTEKLLSQSISQSKKKNIKLFWQGFIQEMFFANDLLWQDFLSELINTPLWWFVSSTLMWELAHTCDGLVFLFFDVKLRTSLRNLCVRHFCPSYVRRVPKTTTFVGAVTP